MKKHIYFSKTGWDFFFINKFIFSEIKFMFVSFMLFYQSILERLFCVKYFFLQDCLSIGSLLLIITKLFFGNFNLYVNFLLFFAYFFISYYFSLNFILKNLISFIFAKGLGDFYVMESQSKNGLAYSWLELLENYQTQPPKRTILNYVFFYFLCFFIFLRLCFFCETILFIFFKFIFCYMLFFNKFTFISYLISILVIFSKFVFFMNDDTYKQFKCLWEDNQPGFTHRNTAIKPDKQGIFHVAAWLISGMNSRIKEIINRNKLYTTNALVYNISVFSQNLSPIWHDAYFSEYKINKYGNVFIKCFLFLFFSWLLQEAVTEIINYFHFGWFLINAKGKSYLWEKFNTIVHENYFSHKIYGKFDENGNLQVTVTTTIKPNYNMPNLYVKQIGPITGAPRATYNVSGLDKEYFLLHFSEPNGTTLFNDDCFSRDIDFCRNLKTEMPIAFRVMQDTMILRAEPSLFLYKDLNKYLFPEIDLYDYKKERIEARSLILKKLYKSYNENEKLKLFLQKSSDNYKFIENNQNEIIKIFQDTIVTPQPFDIVKVKNVIDSFSTTSIFKEAATKAEFELDDGMYDKSLILTKTHKTMHQEYVLQEFKAKKIERNSNKFDDDS